MKTIKTFLQNKIFSESSSLSRTQNTKFNIVFGFLNKIIILFLPFVVRTAFIYTLGVEFLGLDSLFVSILQVLNLSELGLSSAIVYSMYKPLANGNAYLICSLLAFYRKAYRIIGCFIVLLGLCVMPFLRHLINGEIPNGVNIYVLYLLVLFNTALSYFLFAYKQSLFMANQESRFVDNIVSITSIIKSAIQIALLVVFKNYYIYLVVTPLFTIANNLFVGIVAAKHFPQFKPIGSLPQTALLEIKKNIGGLMIQKLCLTTRNSFDSIMISAFIGLSTTAVYNNYFLIISALHGFLAIFVLSMQGSIGNSVVLEAVEKNHEDMQKFMFMYSWISGVCVVSLVCVFQPFMRLWLGENMLLPDYIMYAFCFYLYLMTMGDVMSQYVEANGIFWEMRFRALLESFTNIVLNVVLGNVLGIFGIVLATIISMFTLNFLYSPSILYKNYFKNRKLHLYYLNSLFYLVVTLLVCTIVVLVCKRVAFLGWIGFIAKGLVAFVSTNILYLIIYGKYKYYKAFLLMFNKGI